MSLIRRIAITLAVMSVLMLPSAPWQGQTASAALARGVHVRLLGMGQRDYRAQNATQFDTAAGLRAGLIRSGVSWRWLETNGKGQYNATNLAWLDSVVADANARSLKPVFAFYQSPCWASSDPRKNCSTQSYDPEYPPSNPSDYGDAVAFVAARYGTQLGGIEVWNEPNFVDPWWPGGAAQYAALVKATRAKTSFRPLIGGAVSNADVAYLNQLYDAGARGSWDVFSFHVYPTDPDYCAVPLWSLKCGAPAVRDTMLARGDTAALWITEIGWSTYNTSPADQATYLTRIATMIATMPYISMWFWYELYDAGWYPIQPPLNGVAARFGLLDSKGKEKPAAAVFRGLP
jgi:hypothetical protein